MKTEVRVDQYFYNLQYFHLSLTYGEWGDENIQCCSKTVSGTYPTRDGHDKSFSSHLAKILWWMEECLASGRPFHSSLLSLHLQVVCWPHPSSCLIKSISPPWRKRRGTLYVIDQNISRNLGREWSIRDILQYICFYWVKLYLQFGLALESQVPDTWALTSQLFHIHDTHISHLEENLIISTRPTSSFSNWTVTHYPEFLWCLYIILLTYLIKNTIKVRPPPWSLNKSFNPLTSLSFSFFFCKSNSWSMAITMPASQTVVTIRWDKSGEMLQNLKSKRKSQNINYYIVRSALYWKNSENKFCLSSLSMSSFIPSSKFWSHFQYHSFSFSHPKVIKPLKKSPTFFFHFPSRMFSRLSLILPYPPQPATSKSNPCDTWLPC